MSHLIHNMSRISAILLAPLLPLAGFAATPGAVEVESVVLRPLQSAEVPAQRTGLLKRISVEEGEQVEADQVLATLDPLEASLAVQQARLELAQAEKKANNEVSMRLVGRVHVRSSGMAAHEPGLSFLSSNERMTRTACALYSSLSGA